MKKLFLALVIGLSAILFACDSKESAQQQTPAPVAQGEALNNTICPVTNAAIGSMGKPITVAYQGKVINLCCQGCVADFNREPEKYMAILQGQNTAEPTVDEHSHH